MQAIILAAGMGKRLRELTADRTKCMVEVGGVTLIERTLMALDQCGLSRIILVTGYQKEALMAHVEGIPLHTPVECRVNDHYAATNNIYSLYTVRDALLEEDSIVLESDSVFEQAVLDKLLAEPYGCAALVARPECWMNGAVVSLDENGYIRHFVSSLNFRYQEQKEYFKTVNIYKFDKAFLENCYVPFLTAYCGVWGNNQYYESLLKVVALEDKALIKAIPLEGECWYEINDIQDLDIAETLFAQGPAKVKLYMSRYGGYWRYPAMYDFCYLVNPFFPNERFMDEMKANFETLVREYPSGMQVNSLLAAKYFGLRREQVVVGNGTAELIKSLMENLPGKIGMIYPTFEEYPHRKKEEDILPYPALDKDFTYNVDEVMAYYQGIDIEALILINPDNPSGHFIERKDLLRTARWAQNKGCRLIVDESFVDFADVPERQSLLEQELLEEHPALIVLKSISKSFGVPGLRLGILATADRNLIAFMKKDVAIWNINSFAEYYMQIIEKYKEEYEEAMSRFMGVRTRFLNKLGKVQGLRVFPSQANYVLCELTNGMSSGQLADILLNRYNILIKDLSTKAGFSGKSYVRLSVKTDEENAYILKALEEVLI